MFRAKHRGQDKAQSAGNGESLLKLNEYTHKPVLLEEALQALAIRPDGCYVDCTFGRGGHSRAILQRLGDRGRLLAFDRDPEAARFAREEFAGNKRFSFHPDSFTRVAGITEQFGLQGKVDGLLFDLGVSSPQLDDASRGFSFLREGTLDMRMNPGAGFSAADWINRAGRTEISDVLRRYGEERYAGRIARAITERRSEQAITTTRELAELIRAAVPGVERSKHPATRSFLAIRILVNNELEELQAALSQVTGILRPGGRLAVISFHSGEDRIVKRFIRQQSRPDDYPGYLPVTADRIKPAMRALGRPVKSEGESIRDNPRGRSAILRVAEKLQ